MTVATIYVDKDAAYATSSSATAQSTSSPISVYADSKYGNYWGLFAATFAGVPSTAVLTAAVLYLFTNANIAANYFQIQRLNSAFSEVDGTGAPTINSGVEATIPATASPAYAATSLLSLVQGWVNGTIPNYGLAVLPMAQGYNTTFVSREGASGQQPYFQITYAAAPGAPGAITVPAIGGTYNETIALSSGQASDVDTPSSSLVYIWEYSADGGATWAYVGGSQANATTAAGTTAKTWNTLALAAGNAYRVRVRSYDGTNFGPYTTMGGNFSIIHTSKMKVWSGTAWILRNLSRWSGSAWVTTKLKRWNGTTWIDV